MPALNAPEGTGSTLYQVAAMVASPQADALSHPRTVDPTATQA